MDELWRRTQDPSLHERWDLRFSEIVYLPRPDETAPQRFSYATRIGFGLRIRGEGESDGSRVGARGERVSALKFWSWDAKSLILEGSGYWRYVPAPDGIRFLTWYSYPTRFGRAGRLLDAAAFRPIMGWATAWSFDRLRLWIERGIDPGVSGQRAVIHAVARLCIALVLLYHGLVPKLLSVTWIRTFATRRQSRFDAYMIYAEGRGRIVDYLGTHQHLAVDLELSVDERGGIRIRSGEQRFYEGPVAFTFPLTLSGVAYVCEWYDDAAGRFRIEVAVHNRRWGPLFGYRGSFDVEWRDMPAGSTPPAVRPVREERRE